MPSSFRQWLRLPSRVAMLLGLGALSAAGAGAKAGIAAAPHPAPGGTPIPQQSAMAMGELLIWQEGERILFSEAGRPAEELRLGTSAEAAALRQLLAQENATAATPYVLRDRIILVGSGGAGLHWESQRADEPNKTSAQSSQASGKPPSDTGKARDQVGAAQPPAATNSSK